MRMMVEAGLACHLSTRDLDQCLAEAEERLSHIEKLMASMEALGSEDRVQCLASAWQNLASHSASVRGERCSASRASSSVASGAREDAGQADPDDDVGPGACAAELHTYDQAGLFRL